MNQILAIFDTINAQKETVIAYAKFAGILVFGLLLISSLFRFIFGKKAQLMRFLPLWRSCACM